MSKLRDLGDQTYRQIAVPCMGASIGLDGRYRSPLTLVVVPIVLVVVV